MPGYDKSRFLNLTKNESEQLECGICLAILRKPIITKCCGQAYCQDCIEEWLNKSQTCPNDRKNLHQSELFSAPLLVKNLLNCLNIMCKYKYNGCGEVKLIEFIEIHEEKCKNNPEGICFDCFTENGELSKHNCIANLKEKLDLINQNYVDMTKIHDKMRDTLNRERLSWKRELGEIKTKRYILLNKIKALETEIVECRDENDNISISLKESITECEKFKAEYKKCTLSIQDIVKDYNILKSGSNKKLISLKFEIEQINTDKSNIYVKMKKIEEELSTSLEENEKLRLSLTESIKYSQNLKTQYNRYPQSNQDLKNYNESIKIESRKQINQSIKQYNEVCSKLSEKNQREELLIDRIEKLKSKVSNIKIENENLEEKLCELKNENEILTTQNNNYDRDKSYLKTKISSLNSQLDENNSSISCLSFNSEQLKKELLASHNEINSLNSNVYSNYHELQDKNQENIILKLVIGALIMIIVSLIIYNVLRAHDLCLSCPNTKEKIVVEELIELIKFDRAFDYSEPRTIITALEIPKKYQKSSYIYYNMAFKLELQKKLSSITYDRYAINYNGKYFTVVNIKLREIFNVARIKNAFLSSLKNTEEIWLH